MYLRQLQSFLTVARLLNFGEAARSLNYSQSTVSEQIQGLEEFLGTKLFERIGKKVYLTEKGRRLLPFAVRTVKEAEEIKNLFYDNELVSGTLTIGAAESLCAFWLPRILKEYKSRYPEVQVIIKVGHCPEFPHWLQQNSVDVAFSYNDETGQQQLEQLELFQGETLFLAAPDHKLALKATLEPYNLAGQTLILPEADAGYRRELETLLAKERVKPGAIMEFDSLEAIKQCVKNGLGVTHLPRIAVEDEIKRGELVSLGWQGQTIGIQARMLLHRDKWMSPPLAALRELITDTLCEIK